jgi:hypothetical protein
MTRNRMTLSIMGQYTTLGKTTLSVVGLIVILSIRKTLSITTPWDEELNSA